MKKKSYYIAIRKRINNDFFWDDNNFQFFRYTPPNRRYWYADPFLYEKDGETFIFFESYDRTRRKGEIAVSIIKNGFVSKPKIVLSETFHLSFPYVFSDGNNIYMMPESSEDYSLNIYRSIDFPSKWERVKVLSDVFVCDSILIKDKQAITGIIVSELFREVPVGIVPSCYVKNNYMPINKLTDIRIDSSICVGCGDYGIRNAGALFLQDNSFIRPGQDCTNGEYGKGLVFWKIKSLFPYKEVLYKDLTREKIEKHLQGEKRQGILGVHTYNISSDYEVIDYSLVERYPIIYDFMFLFYLIGKGIKKIIRVPKRVHNNKYIK